MEFTARRVDLVRELQLLQGIIERRATVHTTACVLLEAQGGELHLAATDLEVGLSSRCPASIAKPGAVAVPGRKLYELVKALPETDVRVQVRGSSVRVAADRFDSKMATTPREEFPNLPSPSGKGATRLPGAMLRRLIGWTQFAMTGEDARYFFNGGLLVLRGGSMSLVSTDGHRLALGTVPREGERGPDSRTIIQRKAIVELARLLAEESTDVEFEAGENHLFFQLGGRRLSSRVVPGQFPEFEKLVSQPGRRRAELERDALSGAVRRVALLSNERSRSVRFAFDRGQVEVTSSSQELGEAREQVPAEYDGPAFQVSFAAQYLLEFLDVAETDTIAIEFRDGSGPAVFKPVGAEGYEYTYVLMPMMDSSAA
ncbi:MAG TPA: DNA polymerase III subunit beta [Vicinamibacterales bacterium]|nr:DNA polymerase III subunit beta [Vicinamibacterales bacterium]